MRWEIASPAVIVVAALVLIAWERRSPYNPQQRFFRPGFFDDFVLYTLVQSWVLGLVIDGLIRLIDRHAHLIRMHLVSSWPFWAQLGFFFVVHDFYIYWFHRLQHRWPVLWRIHEAHHSTVDVDWLSGSRSHALEILINQTIEFAPIVLLGGAPEIALAKGVLDAVWGMYIHANVDVHTGRWQKILNGPEMHRWHHAIEIKDVNFATKLALWDWLFGTAHLPKTKPVGYGLAEATMPPGYLAQQAFAFRGLWPRLRGRLSRLSGSPTA